LVAVSYRWNVDHKKFWDLDPNNCYMVCSWLSNRVDHLEELKFAGKATFQIRCENLMFSLSKQSSMIRLIYTQIWNIDNALALSGHLVVYC
jgi:hypothetical protein